MSYGRDDAERGAAEGGAHLGHELLERILPGSKGTGEIAVQPAVVAAGVADLVERGPVPVDRLEIGLRRWHGHVVERRHVEGPIATNAEVNGGRLDESLDRRFDEAGRRERRGNGDVVGQALALGRVEHGEPLEKGMAGLPRRFRAPAASRPRG